MKCTYCQTNDAEACAEFCPDCQKLMREAIRLVLAGAAELIRAARVQEATEKEQAA